MTKKWHVLYSKPRNEKKVVERLSKNGFEVYCPLIKTLRQWSDRKKKVQIPMFPGYIFALTNDGEKTANPDGSRIAELCLLARQTCHCA
jgi:transcriptional antiterminator RfaH